MSRAPFVMKHTLSILAAALAMLLIVLDALPSFQEKGVQASTPAINQGEELLTFLGLGSAEVVQVQAQPGEVIELPELSELPQALDAIRSDLTSFLAIGFAYNLSPASGLLLYRPPTSFTWPGNLSFVLPPVDSPLSAAYQAGGKPFYEEGDQIIIIFPDQQSFGSYFKSTGFKSTFLLETLAYPAIDTPGALEKYMKEYGGTIVAQTDTWVLMKFPSGGFLKVVK